MSALFRRNADKVALAIFLLVLSSTIIQLVVQTLFQRRFEAPSSLYFASIIFLLLLILQHIIASRREEQYVTRIQGGDTIRDLETYLRDNAPKSADFLEYSGESVSPIVKLLYKKDNRCKIRVLLVDPRMAMSINFGQAARNVKNYRENLKPVMQLENSQLELGFYGSPPSLRGRVFDGEYLHLSWYTFVPGSESGDIVVRGEANPSLSAYGVTLEGRLMKDFFSDHLRSSGTLE